MGGGVMDVDTRFEAVRSRDARFDGAFLSAVGDHRDPLPAQLPGLGARTVAVVRSRAPGDPDVAPPGTDVPDSRRPWRAYALHHLRVAGELEL